MAVRRGFGPNMFSRKSNFEPRSTWARYGVAVSCVVLGWMAREALTPAVGPTELPFIFFFPAVVVAALYGGRWPGVLGTLLGAAAANWFFTEPVHSWAIGDVAHAIALSAFVASCLLIVWAIDAMHRARANEARQQSLTALTVASIGDAVIATNETGNVTFLNKEAECLTGWSYPEALGQPLASVFHIINEKTRQRAENPVEKVLGTGKVTGLANHTVLVSKDGKETPIDDSAAPIREGDGPVAGVVLVFRDVTEQRRAHEASARLAAVVEHSGDVILTKNLDGIIQTWNVSAERLFGYRAEEIIGKPATTLFPPERLNEEDHILGDLRQGKAVERLETIRIAKDGRRIPVAVSVSPLRDADGELCGASKVIHDITDLVAAREALLREKELLATTLASIGDAVVVTDAEGRVTFLNEEAERLTRWRSAEAAGQPLPEVFHIISEETRNPVENPVEKVLRLGHVVGLANHTVLIAKDGAEIPIDDSAAPIRHGDGPLFGVVLVFRDFTERKRIEDSLRETAQRSAADLHAMTRLHEVGDLCVQSQNDFDKCLKEILAAAIDIAGADKGNIQLFDATIGALKIATHRGFVEPFLDFFENVGREDASVCGAAFRGDERVIVEDITKSEILAGKASLDVLLNAGVRAVQSTPLKSSAGKLVGMISTHFGKPHRPNERELRLMDLLARQAADYLERKRAEEALRESEERLSGLINSAMDAIIAVDEVQRIVLFNPAAEQMFGCPAAQALGSWLDRFIPARFRETHRHHVAMFGRTGVTARRMGELGALSGLRASGEEFPIEASISQMEAGGKKLFTVILRDITERKKAEERLGRFGAIVEDSEDAIISNRLDGIVTSWNPGAEAMFGYTASEMIGRSVRQIIPQDCAAEEDMIISRLRAGQSTHRETVRVRKDGVRVPVSITCSPIKGASGDVIGGSKIVRDITEQKQTEEKLQEARRKLLLHAADLEATVAERTAKLQDTVNELQHVSYAIAHDMRAPLRAMNTFASLLLEHAAPGIKTAQAEEYCGRIIAAASRLDKLIQDALHYTKVVQQEMPIGPVNLSELLGDLIRTYPNLHAEKADILIENELPKVRGNDALLTQCFSNLLGNAVKFVAPGVRPKVWVRAERRDGAARIWVKDIGIGIPKNAQARLFKMFQKLEAEYEGTGIGLAIVRKVVERMGGKVGVESDAGVGSRFWVELPLAIDENSTNMEPS